MEEEKGSSGICRNMKQMHDFNFKVSSSFDFGSNYSSTSLGEGDLVAAGFSWPPRSYVCSFCKREFRSAQALGGHMNVHRRDRARLRQSPTRDGSSNSNGSGSVGQFAPLNLNVEPSPSFYSNHNLCRQSSPPPPVPSLSMKFPQFTSQMPPPTEVKRCGGDSATVQGFKPIATDFMKVKAAKGILGVDRFDSGCKKRCEGFVRLDLEIGLISPSKEELDLELRLGYT